MLPNRMQLSRSVEEQLKKLKAQTGISPNLSARVAFFKSIETDYRYNSQTEYKANGTLVLDKITWLGRTKSITELLLKHNYPGFTDKQLQHAWAAHVEHGIASLRNVKSLMEFVNRFH